MQFVPGLSLDWFTCLIYAPAILKTNVNVSECVCVGVYSYMQVCVSSWLHNYFFQTQVTGVRSSLTWSPIVLSTERTHLYVSFVAWQILSLIVLTSPSLCVRVGTPACVRAHAMRQIADIYRAVKLISVNCGQVHLHTFLISLDWYQPLSPRGALDRDVLVPRSVSTHSHTLNMHAQSPLMPLANNSTNV